VPLESTYWVVAPVSAVATTVRFCEHPASVYRLTENVPPVALVPQAGSDQLTVFPEAPHAADGAADQTGGEQLITVAVATSSRRWSGLDG